MAYSDSLGAPPRAADGAGRTWDDLRREARKLEGELDVKIAAYGKLCSSFEYGQYARGEAGLASGAALAARGAECEALLRRLGEVGDAMRAAEGGAAAAAAGPRAHTLARHADILRDFSQEYRRLAAGAAAARDRADLLGGGGGGAGGGGPSSPLLNQSSMGQLLRERGAVERSHAALDGVLGSAAAAAAALAAQRALFDGVGGKMAALGARFPVVNSLVNAIRRRKNRDSAVLGAVVAGCLLFTLIYWANK